MGIFIALLMIVISSIIIWYSTAGFEVAADYLGRNLTKGVKGATINAVASSMPEFLATTFFLFYLKDVNAFSGGIGITAGSAVFNILIIPLAILLRAFFSFKVFKIPLERRIIVRDGVYLILTNILLIIILRNAKLYWFHGFSLVIIYVVYTIYMLYDTQKLKIQKKKNHTNSEKSIQEKITDRTKFSLESIILKSNPIQTKTATFLLFVSMIIMTFGTWILVLGTEFLGHEKYILFGYEMKGLNIPLIYVSVLLASAASSIPDTMISIRDTKKGNFTDAISNAFGSNTFDISFALGLPLLAYTLIYQPIAMDEDVRTWSMAMWLVMLAINIIVFMIMTFGKKIGKLKGTLLLILYILFVFFVLEEAVGNSIIAQLAKYLIK